MSGLEGEKEGAQVFSHQHQAKVIPGLSSCLAQMNDQYSKDPIRLGHSVRRS